MTIDEYLERTGINLTELAVRARLTLAELSRVRSGIRQPSGRILQRLHFASSGLITPGDFPSSRNDNKAA